MESSSSTSGPLRCKVCNYEYDICSTTKVEWDRGFTYQHWGSTAFIVTCLCMVVAVAWIIIQLYDNNYIRMLSASVALLMIYICIKLVMFQWMLKWLLNLMWFLGFWDRTRWARISGRKLLPWISAIT